MAAKAVLVADILSARPTHAKALAFERLSAANCRSCGKCCSSKGGFSAAALGGEPAYDTLVSKAPSAGGKIAGRSKFSVVASFSSESCGFQQAGNSCGIYDSRPTVCAAFPFILTESAVGALSSICPPIAEIRGQGVGFLYLSDILGASSTPALDGYPVLIQANGLAPNHLETLPPDPLPILADSLRSLLRLYGLFKRNLSIEPGFAKAGEDIFFPIF